MNRGSFLSQTGREPGQDLAPLPMRGCPSSSPCSGCLGVSQAPQPAVWGFLHHAEPQELAGWILAAINQSGHCRPPWEEWSAGKDPAWPLLTEGTHKFLENPWSHAGDALVLMRRGGSRPVLPALLLSSSTAALSGALQVPSASPGLSGVRHHCHTLPILSPGNKGTA